MKKKPIVKVRHPVAKPSIRFTNKKKEQNKKACRVCGREGH